MMEYKTLESATDNFKDSNMLGAGGFGCVYRGKLEAGNLFVAVKKLSGGNNAHAITEFQVFPSLCIYLCVCVVMISFG